MSSSCTNNLYINFNVAVPKVQHHRLVDEEGNCPTLLCSGVASPWALCAVLGTAVKKRYYTIRECSKEDSKDGGWLGGGHMRSG